MLNEIGDHKIDLFRLSAESATKKPIILKYYIFFSVHGWSQSTKCFHQCCNFASKRNKYYFSSLIQLSHQLLHFLLLLQTHLKCAQFQAGLCWQTCLRTSSRSYPITVVEVCPALLTSLSGCSSSKIWQKWMINQQVNQNIHKVKSRMAEAWQESMTGSHDRKYQAFLVI